MAYKTPLGDMLLIIRRTKKMTARRMAQSLNISASFLDLVERGDRHLPDSLFRKILEKYAETSELRQNLLIAYAKTYGKLILFCDDSISLCDIQSLIERILEDDSFPFLRKLDKSDN